MTVTDIHNKNTQAFIDENPITVAITRRIRVQVPGGGWAWEDDETIPDQECRLVHSGNVSDAQSLATIQGRVVRIEAKFVFLIGANVQEGDIIPVGEKDWEVVRVWERYSTVAEVVRSGS